VETADGWVHALIGDVCGRGPTEAALGVCLRVAWRALVLAARSPGEILGTLNQLLEHERQDDTMFATLCMTSIDPARTSAWVRLAGHMPPMLVTGSQVTELEAPACPPPGLSGAAEWPDAQFELDGAWSLLLFTDGLIEGRVGTGSERLGSDGLMKLISAALPDELSADQLLDRVIDRVRKLNQGDLDDDLAVLMLGYAPGPAR
jgi:serine phosphatase RsbU (regulator of sigma subunit)